MKQKISETVEIPEGISCEVKDKVLTCKKGSEQLSKSINIPSVKISVKGNEILFLCEKGNKIQFKIIRSYKAHVKNMFHGLNEKFVYTLQAVNVHFPMTLKSEGNKLLINNFLGEKNPRKAVILPGVKMDIKGQIITLTSSDRESAGHTAANIEKATKIRNRDRRIFQDGIYLVEKPGREE